MNKKPNKFKILHGKLNEALEYGFYIEALVIEYAIIDNRLRKLADIMQFNYSRNDFKTRFKELKNELRKLNEYLSRNLSAKQDFINDFIRDRNLIIHGLADFDYNRVFIEKTALDGIKAVDYFQNLSQKVKKINRLSLV